MRGDEIPPACPSGFPICDYLNGNSEIYCMDLHKLCMCCERKFVDFPVIGSVSDTCPNFPQKMIIFLMSLKDRSKIISGICRANQ